MLLLKESVLSLKEKTT